MLWRIVLKYFGPNIQIIAVFDNIVADTCSRLSSTYVDKYDTSTSKDQCRANDLFAIVREEKRVLFPAKYLKSAKRTTKRADKIKFQNQHMYFGSGIQLIQAKYRLC